MPPARRVARHSSHGGFAAIAGTTRDRISSAAARAAHHLRITQSQDDSNDAGQSNCHASDQGRKLSCCSCRRPRTGPKTEQDRGKAGARVIPHGVTSIRHGVGSALFGRRADLLALPSGKGRSLRGFRFGVWRRAPTRRDTRANPAPARLGGVAGPDLRTWTFRSDLGPQVPVVRTNPVVRTCRRDRRCRPAPSGGRDRRSSTGSWSRPRCPRGGSDAPRSRQRGSGRRRSSAG